MGISVRIKNLGKKFNSKWIFKNVDLNIYSGEKIAILGPNGCGKSTFLKILSGFMTSDKGSIEWEDYPPGSTPTFSFSSPYLELFEYLTVKEQLGFHFKLHKPLEFLTPDEILDISRLTEHSDKQIKQLSSGMKQRLKNAQAIFSDTEILFLDEPCSNLDAANISRYQEILKKYAGSRMVLIASNSKDEYDFISTKEFGFENGALNLLKNKQLWA